MKTLGANKDAALPLKLFEVGDVILLAPESETGSRNERRLVALYCGKESGFEVVHGLLNLLMQVLGVPLLSAPPPPALSLVGWPLVGLWCITIALLPLLAVSLVMLESNVGSPAFVG